MPEFAADERSPSISQTQEATSLQELFAGAYNDIPHGEADASDAVVRGFREGVRLMPHQIHGRHWMRSREDFTQKRAGGILADDMGLGKTIQSVTCVVDNPCCKEDRAAGWKPATLVVCPLAMVDQWDAEIKKMTVGLTVKIYHGPNRKADISLADADVVITTYNTLCSEHQRSPFMFEIPWWRIILDEAHTIKTRTTKTAAACFDLLSKFRWCLTATPMQNKVDDFFSLLNFLHIRPLNDWDSFNRLIAQPIAKNARTGLAMKRLQVVLKHIMLRRTKEQLQDFLKLPARTVYSVPCKFNRSELQFYTALRTKVQALLKRILAKGKNGGAGGYMNVLVLLLRLRQACDHPILVLEDYADDLDAIYPEADKLKPGEIELDDLDDHKTCHGCTIRNSASEKWPSHCIDCVALQVQAQNLHGPMSSSAKTREILKLLREIGQRPDNEKTIIFSQFTSMLDLIEPFLSASGTDFVRYDGTMSLKERRQVLKEIETNPRKTVMLVSLKAGGSGLNLTACNNVILVDMWWNPAVEEQAFDRAHRVGQTRDVHIYKLKIDDTVEDRILALQEKKRALTKAALSGDQIKNKKLGMVELLELFK
ncbi:SNF2 family N-terminal domain-containing protein [Mycena rebaudengoi]|nr:SNF2 family N-terminal domain-containing protein [Mycena rebaudengoi]